MVTEVTGATFSKEVSQSHQTVLVDFWASWCGPCRMQGPIIEAFAEENPAIKVCKVNVDENPELAERFGIMSIPSLLIFRGGKMVKSAIGLHDKSDLAALLK